MVSSFIILQNERKLYTLSIMSRSGGLKPRAVAGSPSVTRLTHNSCTGIRASGKPNAAVKKILQQQLYNN